MKNILLIILLLKAVVIHSQSKIYDVTDKCFKGYDTDLEIFRPWGDWNSTDHKNAIYSIAVSANVLKYEYTYDSEYLSRSEIYKCKFIADQPDKDFSFKKKVEITYTVYKSSYNKAATTEVSKGFGWVYGATTLEELLNGTMKGVIYIYYEFENYFQSGKTFKGYEAFKI